LQKERVHISKKLAAKPKFVSVRTEDTEKDMPNDIKAPNKIMPCFLSILTMATILNDELIEHEENKY